MWGGGAYVWFFKTGFLCEAQAVLELSLYLGHACLCLLSAGMKGVRRHHHLVRGKS